MQYRILGKTNIKVSRLCFGSLTIGPLQASLPIQEGADIIRMALEAGVNFIDTAELYNNYDYIREALRNNEHAHDVVIVSKCYADTYDGMRESVQKALKQLGRDYLDVFLLHEQESDLTIKGHWGAIEYLLEAKNKGMVRALGISTHHVDGVLGAATISEVDVIHPLLNLTGIGIRGGTRDDMISAVKYAADAGKGIYAMKALGGGNLLSRREEAFKFIMAVPELASVAVGMSTSNEVYYNTRLFSGLPISKELKHSLRNQPRGLHIENWCTGCGQCVEKCSAKALRQIGAKIVVDSSLCLLCGYCGAACPEFCIRVV